MKRGISIDPGGAGRSCCGSVGPGEGRHHRWHRKPSGEDRSHRSGARIRGPRSRPKPDIGYAKRMFSAEVSPKKKSYVCFVRQYDSAHLAQHPAQKVTAMKLLVTAEIVPEDSGLNYGFRLGVKLKGKSGEFSSGGECGHVKVSEGADGERAPPLLGRVRWWRHRRRVERRQQIDAGEVWTRSASCAATAAKTMTGVISAAARTTGCSASTALRLNSAVRWPTIARNLPPCAADDGPQPDNGDRHESAWHSRGRFHRSGRAVRCRRREQSQGGNVPRRPTSRRSSIILPTSTRSASCWAISRTTTTASAVRSM